MHRSASSSSSSRAEGCAILHALPRSHYQAVLSLLRLLRTDPARGLPPLSRPRPLKVGLRRRAVGAARSLLAAWPLLAALTAM